MIELIKFANSFKYIHTIIKNNITENEWDNCLLTYYTIKAFYLNSNYKVTVDKDNEFVKVIDSNYDIICKFENGLENKLLIESDLLIVFNKEEYRLFSSHEFDENLQFVGYYLANIEVINLAKKDYYLLSTLVAMYYEKIKSCLIDFLFSWILGSNKISHDKKKYKEGDLLEIDMLGIQHEMIMKKYKKYFVTENYIVIRDDDYLSYHRIFSLSKKEKECLVSKGSFEAKLFNLSLSKIKDKRLISADEITSLNEIKNIRNNISHENYNAVLQFTIDEIVSYGNKYLDKIKLMQSVLKRINRIGVEFDFMEVSHKMTQDEYETNVDINSEEKLRSFTNNIISTFTNNMLLYEKSRNDI
jgi:hypothetical protein